MSNKYMKRLSRSLIIRKMLIKTTIKYYSTPIGMAKMQKTINTKWISYILGRSINWQNHCGNLFGSFL